MSIEITLKEVEVTKLNLQPGDLLTVTIKNEDITEESLKSLKSAFNYAFPNNKVLLIGLNENDEVKFSVTGSIPTLECGTQNYCSDCNCGKKEQAEVK